MAITKTKKEGVDELLELLDRQTKKIRKRLDDSAVNTSPIVEEKKEVTQPKKKYISKLKVACIIGVITLSAALWMTYSVPSFYDIIADLFRDMWPSLENSAGSEFYVD